MTKTAAIYARISVNDPTVPKVGDQEAMCRTRAQQEGLKVLDEFVYPEDGITASKFLDRPQWKRLLEDAAEGKFNVLMAQSEDRFSRQPIEIAQLQLACALGGVTWLTINDGEADPGSATGSLMPIIRAGVSRTESLRKAERQRQANDAVRAKGQPLKGGDRPFGYEADKVTLRPSEASLIKAAYQGFIAAEGKTLSAIRTEWNNNGVVTSRGKPWDIAKVEKVLRRPRNIRLVQSRNELLKDESGEYLRGKWHRIIDDDTYYAAILKLDSPTRRLTRQHVPKWLMSGLARCGACGGPMRGFQRAKEAAYRCAVHNGTGHKVKSVRHVNIVTHELENVVTEEVISAVLLSPDEAVPDPDVKVLRDAYQRISTIGEQRSRLLDLMEDDDDIADIRAKRTALKEEADDLQQVILNVQARNARAALISETHHALWNRQRRSADFMDGESMFEDAASLKTGIRERFAALSLEQRRALVAALLTVTVENGRGPQRVRVVHKVALGLNDRTGEHDVDISARTA
jgi:site-specific DNA recombinase